MAYFLEREASLLTKVDLVLAREDFSYLMATLFLAAMLSWCSRVASFLALPTSSAFKALVYFWRMTRLVLSFFRAVSFLVRVTGLVSFCTNFSEMILSASTSAFWA